MNTNTFECPYCKRNFTCLQSFSNHLYRTHKIKYKDYYDLNFKKEGDGICSECGKNTSFRQGKYTKFCSCTCSNKNSTVKDKMGKSMIKRFGCRYSGESELLRNKQKITCKEKYGCEWAIQSKKVKDKIDKTMLERYGTKCSMQVKEVYEKVKASNARKKKYILPSGIEIKLQGFEPQFLDYIFENNILQENEIEYETLSIGYLLEDNTHHMYYPDFYIPKWNLIVEIKGSNWYVMYKDKNIAKEKTVKSLGYNYIIIIDNDFGEFSQIIKK